MNENILMLDIPTKKTKLLSEYNWKVNYQNLKNYFDINNKLPTDRKQKIGVWLSTQKRSFKKQTLSQEKINLLLEITPDFFEERDFNKIWTKEYKVVKSYFKKHNKLPDYKNENFGTWINTQKGAFKKQTLSQERINLLLEITPNFFEKDIRQKIWKDNYNELKSYFEEHNKLPDYKNKNFGTWINNQRLSFKKNTLSKERINLLLDISPDFFKNKALKNNWIIKYKEVKSYFEEHNKLPDYKNENFGTWIDNQKLSFNRNTLTQERINLLLEITPDFFKRKR